MAKLAPPTQGPFWLALNEASQKVPVTLVDETDLATLETGITTPTIQASKNGAALSALSDGTWAELANGIYTITLNATDTNTLGWLLLRIIESGTSAEAQILCYVSQGLNQFHQNMIRNRTMHRRGQ